MTEPHSTNAETTNNILNNKFIRLLHTTRSHCTQSDQWFETGKYAIKVTCFAADFTSIKTPQQQGIFLPIASTNSVKSKALQQHLLG